MKKQWEDFIEANESNWSYGIVPRLVNNLAEAVENGDVAAAQDARDGLAEQGVIVTPEENLAFLVDLVCRDLLDDDE